MRTKYRFLVFRVHTADAPALSAALSGDGKARKLYYLFSDQILANFGELGLGQVQESLQVKHYQDSTGYFLVRALQSCTAMVSTALTLTTSIGGVAVSVVSCATHGREQPCLKQLLRLSAAAGAGPATATRPKKTPAGRGTGSSTADAVRPKRARRSSGSGARGGVGDAPAAQATGR